MAFRNRNLKPPRIDLRSGISDSDEWLKSGKWVKVKSSNVSAIRYDYVKRWLLVEFGGKPKKGGGTTPLSVYVYYGVPPDVAKYLFEAASLGKYVHQVLKADGYRYTKL